MKKDLSWSVCGLETQGRMRADWSLLELEMLLEQLCWLNGEPFCRLEANSYGLKTEKSCWKGGSR